MHFTQNTSDSRYADDKEELRHRVTETTPPPTHKRETDATPLRMCITQPLLIHDEDGKEELLDLNR